jgi:HTH-type transcriptional regulator/antitoxin HipB
MRTPIYKIQTPDQLSPIFTAFRKRNNLSQAQLAQRIGVTQQTVSQLERNPGNATVGRLLRALAAMDVEMVLQSKFDPAAPKPKPEGNASSKEIW